jgi:hypothetical protein
MLHGGGPWDFGQILLRGVLWVLGKLFSQLRAYHRWTLVGTLGGGGPWGHCYHLVYIIRLTLAQSDHIKQLPSVF